jgi:hypothetical protein
MVCEASDHKLKVCTSGIVMCKIKQRFLCYAFQNSHTALFATVSLITPFPCKALSQACLTRSVSIAFSLLFSSADQRRMYFIWAMDSNVPSPQPAFPYAHLQSSNLPSSWSALHTKYPHIWSSNLRLCITSQTRWVAKNTITVVRQVVVFLLAYGHLVRRHCPEGGECRIASRRTKYE